MDVKLVPVAAQVAPVTDDKFVVWGLGWAEIIAIIALLVPIVVQAVLLHRQKIRERISATLEIHREYNSTEMADARTGAIAFVEANRTVNWVTAPDLSDYDSATIRANSLFEIMRYFHRVNVVRKHKTVDESILAELLGPELAWWDGFIFDRMSGRTHSRTIEDIQKLSGALKPKLSSSYWLQQNARGDSRFSGNGVAS